MSRDPRVFEVIEKQTYNQSEDRIRLLSAAINGLSSLMWDYLRTGELLTPAENEMIRAELIKSLIRNHDHFTDEQVTRALNQIEAGLESNNE